MQYTCSFLMTNYINAVFHAIIPFKLVNTFITAIKKAGYTGLVKQLSLRTCTHN